MEKRDIIFIVLSIIVIFCVTSCGRDKQGVEAIATVNGTPIPLKEFEKELTVHSKRDPDFKITPRTVEEQLNLIVEKQLMIQEAMKMGLTKEERFVDTIKTFWEQTLIRELIEAKSKEWENRLFVTEEEIQREYQKMRDESGSPPPLQKVYDPIKSALLEQKRERLMEEWVKEIKKGARIEINAGHLKEVSHGP